jgi:hypothetical protein
VSPVHNVLKWMVFLIDGGKILVKFLYKGYDQFSLCELLSFGVFFKPWWACLRFYHLEVTPKLHNSHKLNYSYLLYKNFTKILPSSISNTNHFKVRITYFNFRLFICFQSDIYQTLYWYNWFSWWWAHGCPKHVEIWNEHIWKKNCASSWLFTTKSVPYSRRPVSLGYWNLLDYDTMDIWLGWKTRNTYRMLVIQRTERPTLGRPRKDGTVPIKCLFGS